MQKTKKERSRKKWKQKRKRKRLRKIKERQFRSPQREKKKKKSGRDLKWELETSVSVPSYVPSKLCDLFCKSLNFSRPQFPHLQNKVTVLSPSKLDDQ